jgi:serine/threonine protein phosphatase 1
MTKTYVITDIHGHYNLLSKALETIPKGSKIVFLGDYVDRGPDSYKVVERIKQGQETGLPWIALKGNHEDMMVQALTHKREDYIGMFYHNGGFATMDSYDTIDLDGTESKLNAHLSWMESLPLYHEDTHRVYVHAYVDTKKTLGQHSKQELLWERYYKHEEGWHRGKHVVHGHTPHKEVVRKAGRTNLDTGAAWKEGKLTIGVFDDDKPHGPVETIEIKHDG